MSSSRFIRISFTAFKPVLLTLYPLIRHSLIKHHLEMTTIKYRDDDVRSSELETGQSSNAKSLSKEVDMVLPKSPSSSSSTLLHALSKSCSIKGKHLKGFRKRFQFPKGTITCLPHSNKKSCTFPMVKCASIKLLFCAAFVSHPSIHHGSSF